MYAGQILESSQLEEVVRILRETDIFVLNKMYADDKFQKFQKGEIIDNLRVEMAQE